MRGWGAVAVALFTLLPAGCAGRPQGSADPGPPILITEEMDASRQRAGEPVTDELLEAVKRKLLEPTWKELGAPSFLITNYLWRVFVPRSSSVGPGHLYNPAYSGDRERAYAGDQSAAELATRMWRVSRSPESLRRNWAAHRTWLYAVLDRNRYALQGFETYVDELLRVEAHIFNAPDAAARLREMSAQLALGTAGERDVAFPARSNTHRVAYFGELYDQGAEQRLIRKHCLTRAAECTASCAEMALWLHTFWYRRNLEDNRAETSKILKEIQAHYK